MSERPNFQAGVLTVSDSASADASLDKSGPLLCSLLAEYEAANIDVVSAAIVPDDTETILREAQQLCANPVDVIFATGGTGFAPRDVTPEALSPLIDKPTPALTHALTAWSLTKTPLAALSRSVTGIHTGNGRHTLILALPGSPKAVKEYMELLLSPQSRLLLHALKLLGQEDVRDVHASMQQGGSGGCKCCSAGHATAERASDMRAPGPPGRARHSPYPMIALDDALHRIDVHVARGTDTLLLEVGQALIGHVLAADIVCDQDLPLVATTNVDGYAVQASSFPPGTYEVRGSSASSMHRINTGQALPPGTDSVIMVEDTRVVSTSEDGKQELSVELLRQVKAGENVRAAGSDLRKGQTALHKGTTISELGGEIGTLAFVGRTCVQVYRQPTVALLSTGNELVDIGAQSEDAHGQQGAGIIVNDANRPGLKAAVSGQGFSCIDLGIVDDDEARLVDRLKRGFAEADVVLTTGGTSMGETDLLKLVLQRDFGADIHFGRVAMKPGKPTAFATVKLDGRTRYIFTLPGNPASAMVCFDIFALPALRKLAGRPGSLHPRGFGQHGQPQAWPANPWSLARVEVLLDSGVSLDPRPEFHRIVIYAGPDGQLHAASTGKQRSSGMHSMATANGLLCLPPLAEGQAGTVPAGSKMSAVLLGPIA